MSGGAVRKAAYFRKAQIVSPANLISGEPDSPALSQARVKPAGHVFVSEPAQSQAGLRFASTSSQEETT
jgi:hypothetical protein